MSSTELISRLWDFVHGRTSIRQFEELVYEEHESLSSIVADEKVTRLMELDFAKANVARLRFDVGKAIAAIEMPCACLRFPSSTTTDRGDIALPPLVDSAFALVEHCVETSLALIAKDPWYARRWRVSSGNGVANYLQEGCFYCCRVCSRSFLIVLDETDVDYLVLQLSARELAESTPQQLRERFAADFGRLPMPPADAN